MNVSGKHVIVVGLGKSGISAARLCRRLGARVTATDSQPLEKLAPEVAALDAELRLGGHDGVEFTKADLILVSPGVPSFPELARAESAGVPVVGELGFATSLYRAPLLVVGGTNGKSTTTSLLGALMTAGGKKVFVGGNLGTPAAEAVDGDYEAIVLEVSSFQLERAPSIEPRVSILLNITEDHLDRYASFQDYADAKGNAFVNQGESDVAIVPSADDLCRRQAQRGRARLVEFGGGDYAVQNGRVIEAATGEVFDLRQSRLHGRHNHENAAAAIAAARAVGVAAEAVREGIAGFEPLPHRMAKVAEVRGVTFYDDSKGTNVGASVTALRGLTEERGVLIAGGRDKHGSYEPLVQALRDKGRAIVLIGEAAPRIAEAVGDALPLVRAGDMPGAVRAAFTLAEHGDAVLLSPACSSFDMFKSYADRGDRFRDAVLALAKETP